jgi:hypothetical protein
VRNNFHELNVVGEALAPTNIATGTLGATGLTIKGPGKIGRQLTFILTAASLTGVTALPIRVQYNKNDGNGWLNLKQNDGSTDVTFPAARTIAAGPLDNNAIIGTIPLDRTRDGDYRIVVGPVAGAAANISAAFVVSELYTRASSQVDELLGNVIPTGN